MCVSADFDYGPIPCVDRLPSPAVGLNDKATAAALLNGGVARSDTDSQLILYFPFRYVGALRRALFLRESALFRAAKASNSLPLYWMRRWKRLLMKFDCEQLTHPRAPSLVDTCPAVTASFVNRAALGFEDLEDLDATQTIKLSAADFGGDKQIKLKTVAFQRVNGIHLFFDGAGEWHVRGLIRVSCVHLSLSLSLLAAENTSISTLKFIGQLVQGMDAGKLEKVGHDE